MEGRSPPPPYSLLDPPMSVYIKSKDFFLNTTGLYIFCFFISSSCCEKDMNVGQNMGEQQTEAIQ